MGQHLLQTLVDRGAVGSLLDRYACVFDERNFSEVLPALFSFDCVVDLPPGTHQGVSGLDKFHADVMARFAGTQHVFTNYIIDLDGDHASFRANAHVTHVELDDQDVEGGLFVVGAVVTGSAVRTDGRWLIRSVCLEPTWRQGGGPGPDMHV